MFNRMIYDIMNWVVIQSDYLALLVIALGIIVVYMQSNTLYQKLFVFGNVFILASMLFFI